MIYQNFKSLKEFKQHFKDDLQYLTSLSTNELLQQLDTVEATTTNWVYNFCSIEYVDGTNYINLFWNSENGKSYNLMHHFKEFTDFYNNLLDIKFLQTKLCNLVDTIANENWKF